MTYARHISSCSQEHFVLFLSSQLHLIDVISITLSPSEFVIVSLSYFSNVIKTALGRFSEFCSLKNMSFMIPIDLLTSSASVYMLFINITLLLFTINRYNLRLFTTSVVMRLTSFPSV